MIPQSAAIAIQEALFTGDAERLRDRLEKLLETSVSFYDTAKESFYHGLMLGLLATLDNRYQVLSNGNLDLGGMTYVCFRNKRSCLAF